MSARILIIEDNSTNMELMIYLLKAFGHTAIAAYDGEAGIAIAQLTSPDLIVCDVHLPKLDGYGIIKKLKADSALCTIPVIAVTALSMTGDREKLMAAGFDSYIGKPLDPVGFVRQIEEFLPESLSVPN